MVKTKKFFTGFFCAMIVSLIVFGGYMTFSKDVAMAKKLCYSRVELICKGVIR